MTRNDQNVFCPACSEKYKYSPTEDLIQCRMCDKWWHEDCTTYVEGHFTSDLCTK